MRRAILLLVVVTVALVAASGTAFAVLKIGTDGPDTLVGTSSADQITGNAGSDTLKGLAGNDVYYFDDGWGYDTLDEPATQRMRKNGKWRTISGGSDTLSFSQTTTGVGVYLIRQWGPGWNRVFDFNVVNFVQLGNSAVENAVGGMGVDRIHGGGEKNTLQPGGGGNDFLFDYGGILANTSLNPNQPGLPASNDVFKGFESNSGTDFILDYGGTADVLDLKPFSSSDVYIDAIDQDGNGTKESLQIVYRNGAGAAVQVLVVGHFGAYSNFTSDQGQQGRIEQLVFSDGTFSGEGEVGSSAASAAAASDEEASANDTVEALISASRERAKITKEGAQLENAAGKLLKEAKKELKDAPSPLPTEAS